MTPKEKAATLIKGMALAGAKRYDEAVACALIAVDEILGTFIIKTKPDFTCYEIEYWKEVKQEIENLKF